MVEGTVSSTEAEGGAEADRVPHHELRLPNRLNRRDPARIHRRNPGRPELGFRVSELGFGLEGRECGGWVLGLKGNRRARSEAMVEASVQPVPCVCAEGMWTPSMIVT